MKLTRAKVITGGSIFAAVLVLGGAINVWIGGGGPGSSGQTATTFPNYSGGTCTSPAYTLSTAGAEQDFGTFWTADNQSTGGSGTSVMSVCNPASWYQTVNQTDGGSIAWFVHSGIFLGTPPVINNTAGIPLNQFSSISSTYGSSLPTGECDCEAAYDIWFNSLCETATAEGPPYSDVWSNPPDDTMIWNQWTSYGNGQNNFSGDDSQASWAKEIETNGTAVTLGGVAYHWQTQNGLGNEKIFVRDTPTASGTVDILAVLNYLAARTATSLISPTSCLSAISYGFEVNGTNGSQRLDVNNFQMTTS